MTGAAGIQTERNEIFMLKRLIAMLAVSALLLGGTFLYYDRHGLRTDGLYYEATGIRPDAQIMTVNGQKVEAEEYFYWLDSVCEYLNSYVGGNLDFSAQITEEMTFSQYAKSDAANTITLYQTVRQMAQKHNITLTEEDLAALAAQREQYVAYYGGEEGYALQLQLLGVNEALMNKVEEVPYLYNRMYQNYCDPEGALYPGEDTLQAYADENGYVTAQLLYFPIAGLDEAALSDMKAQAEDYAKQLAAAADKQATYETLAAQLGLTTSAEGLTFCAADVDASLYQPVTALTAGQVSGVIETPGGYYVALRVDTNYGALTEVLFNIYLQEWQDSAKVEYSDRVYASLDAGAFYAGMDELRMALVESLLAQG